jgi:hypothetical protein
VKLVFEKRGTTWTCRNPAWEVMLIARNVYHGTERIMATLTLARDVPNSPHQKILTDRLDLMVAARRTRFAKEAASRIAAIGSKASAGANEASVLNMVEGFMEHLIAVSGEIESHSLLDIEELEDMTPPYTLWPMVPSSRPGMLVSPSGSGKSTLAAAIGLSVATGASILERLDPRVEGPVLYIGQEESKEQWANRVRQMCRGHEIRQPKHFHYMKLANASLVESAERVAEAANGIKAKLVIIDSVQATWGAESDSVRGWATQWFNAVELLEVPTLVIDHPNRSETGAGKQNDDGFAAGSSVKRDRVGHSWALKSLQLPTRPDDPIRYHVTLRDTKRNYVARQDDINYITEIYRYDWIRLSDDEAISAGAVIDASRAFTRIMELISVDPSVREWSAEMLAERLGYKDSRHTRRELNNPIWRADPDDIDREVRFVKVEGTGVRGNIALYRLERRRKVVQLSIVGDE